MRHAHGDGHFGIDLLFGPGRLSKAKTLLRLWFLIPCLLTQSQEVGFSGLVNPRRSDGSSDYVIRNWGQEDGLPRSGVHSIAQTPDGFLWLGTPAGLTRFDGVEFKILSPYTTPEVPVGAIETLFVDSPGRLWIGSLRGGVARLEGNTISEIDMGQVKAYGIHSFAEDQDGRVWISSEGGIFYVEGEQAVEDPARGGHSGTSASIAIDSNSGGLYTCYWESVGLWKDRRFDSIYVLNSSDRISSQHIYPRRDGGLWFLSASGNKYGSLMRLIEPLKVTEPQAWPFEIVQYGIGAFLEDRRGNLWVAVTGDGLYRVAPNGEFEHFEIGNREIVSLFEDRDGSVWAGSRVAGLTRFNPRLFQNYSAPVSGGIGTVSESPSGYIVFNKGTGTFGLLDGKLEHFGSLSSYGVFADRGGYIWTANPGAIVQLLRIGGKFEKVLSFTERPAHRVRCFLEAKNGQMWFGSQMGGLLTSDGLQIIELPEVRRDAIHSLCEDANGTIWAGTSEGDLWTVSEDQLTRLELESKIDHRAISALHFDSEGVLWMGTMGKGIVFQKGDEFVAVRMADGLPSDEVSGIIGVGPYLWVATTRGIVRVPRNELYNRTAESGPLTRCLVFDRDDGLVDSACASDCFPTMHLAKNGRLWISMVENLVSVDPEQVFNVSTSPEIYIEEVRINDRTKPVTADLLVVPPGTARLSFTYTTPMLDAPDRARFQYRLEGLDGDWVDSWEERSAHYTAPPPGSYRFLVRAASNRGEWGDTVASLGVTIEPFFWQTLPFKVTIVVFGGCVLGLMVWLATRATFARRLVRSERANAVEKERTRIARGIHDQLGAQLTQILFQSHSLTSRLEDESDHQAFEQASKVKSSARQLAQSLDEVVWVTNPEMDNLEGVVAYITNYAEEFFRHTDIRLRLDVPTRLDMRELPSDSRHELFLACSEAMTNILKHAEATEALLRMRSSEAAFTVEISDNGVGMAPEPSKRLGNGLRNMKERMRAIGGTVDFLSRGSKGASIRLTVSVITISARVSPKKGTHKNEEDDLV